MEEKDYGEDIAIVVSTNANRLVCVRCGGDNLYQPGVGFWPTRQAGQTGARDKAELIVPFHCIDCDVESALVLQSVDKGGREKLLIKLELTEDRAPII